MFTDEGLTRENWDDTVAESSKSWAASTAVSLVGAEIAGAGGRGGGAADVGSSADSASPARPSNEEIEAVFGNPVVASAGEGIPRTQFELTRNLVDQYLLTYSDPWLAWDAVSSARIADAGFDNPVFRDAEHHLLRHAMASQGERIWSQEGFSQSLTLKTEPLRGLFSTMGAHSRAEMCSVLRQFDLVYYGLRDTAGSAPGVKIGATGPSMRVWEDIGYLEGYSSNPTNSMRPFVQGIFKYYKGR
jgi:hypothetical protein